MQSVKLIRTALALLAIVSSAPHLAHAADAPAAGCRLLKIGEVPIKFEHNQPLVEVSINGQPAWFIVDTGSGSTMMFGGAAKALKLNAADIGNVDFYGVGGKQTATLANVASFKLAGFEQKNLPIFVTGKDGSPERAGLLGRDYLGQVDLEVDMAAHVLRLFKPDRCGSQSLAYWTQTPEIADLRHDDAVEPFKIGVLVNGRRIEAILDTGATTSVITLDAARRAGVQPTDYVAAADKTHGIGSEAVTTQVAVFDTVAIGDEQIKHAKLNVGDLFAGDTEMHLGSHIGRQIDLPEMLLGADFFRSHRVFLVTSQKRAYFTYSGGPVFQIVGEAVKAKDETAAAPPPSAPTPAAKP